MGAPCSPTATQSTADEMPEKETSNVGHLLFHDEGPLFQLSQEDAGSLSLFTCSLSWVLLPPAHVGRATALYLIIYMFY